MNFSDALTLIKQGAILYRKGWNGCDMFVYLVDGSKFKVSRPPLDSIFEVGRGIVYAPHLDMRYTDGTCGVWTATNTDIMANDWETYEGIL